MYLDTDKGELVYAKVHKLTVEIEGGEGSEEKAADPGEEEAGKLVVKAGESQINVSLLVKRSLPMSEEELAIFSEYDAKKAEVVAQRGSAAEEEAAADKKKKKKKGTVEDRFPMPEHPPIERNEAVVSEESGRLFTLVLMSRARVEGEEELPAVICELNAPWTAEEKEVLAKVKAYEEKKLLLAETEGSESKGEEGKESNDAAAVEGEDEAPVPPTRRVFRELCGKSDEGKAVFDVFEIPASLAPGLYDLTIDDLTDRSWGARIPQNVTEIEVQTI